MNLKRQLFLVSLLTLLLPWAGCEFIRETESALRQVQQDMLSGNARTLANSLAQYPEDFPPTAVRDASADRLFIHALDRRPQIDGYFDDWSMDDARLATMRGADGPIKFLLAEIDGDIYLYVEVRDKNIVYAVSADMARGGGRQTADRVALISTTPPLATQAIVFAAEAPGLSVGYLADGENFDVQPNITAYWQDFPRGYRIEARIPAHLLGSNLGLTVLSTVSSNAPATRSQSYVSASPGPVARRLDDIQDRLSPFVPAGMRAIVTDAGGWRIAIAGDVPRGDNTAADVWSRRIYDALVEPGRDAVFAEPAPLGREREAYIDVALDGDDQANWFRSATTGRAIVAAATPVIDGGEVIGALVLQQGTDAILSLTNSGLARLINVTVIATLLVAIALLGYATWLSRRIRRLSRAAEAALDEQQLDRALPSAESGDEVGDLSRSFSDVLRRLGDYNAYLRTLASKLSHELRTPLAIVTSSLDNLEHQELDGEAQGYVRRAGDGAMRLRRILDAMSEANRVEELMETAEAERFELTKVVSATVQAYRDVYSQRNFSYSSESHEAWIDGSPELLVQMLDKLVDNAVSFSADDDTIDIEVATQDAHQLSVSNPGPPLPDTMRAQLFDSMISLRRGENSRHLGLGLYIARLVAEGHGGSIDGDNTTDGVRFTVTLPVAAT